jgi:cellulose synthase (UDP-forming)
MNRMRAAPYGTQQEPAAARAEPCAPTYLAQLTNWLRCYSLSGWAIFTTWLVLLAAILVLATIKLDLASQARLSFAVVAVMLVLRRFGWVDRTRLFFLFCFGFLTLRYVYWRTTETLGYTGLANFVCMLLLYGAELYGIVIALISLFVNSAPLRREGPTLLLNAGPRGTGYALSARSRQCLPA